MNTREVGELKRHEMERWREEEMESGEGEEEEEEDEGRETNAQIMLGKDNKPGR